MLGILSPSSVTNKNVMDEVSFAMDEGKSVIPALYRDCRIPFRLRRVQYVDFRTEYESGLRELVKALGVEERAVPEASKQQLCLCLSLWRILSTEHCLRRPTSHCANAESDHEHHAITATEQGVDP